GTPVDENPMTIALDSTRVPFFTGTSCNSNLILIFPRLDGHFYDVDKGVRDERREEEVQTAVPSGI
ncbi:MAG: hypothetical protein ACRDAM_22225, partial [Casimicrobium sp.]